MKKQILFALVALLLALPSAQAAKPNFIVVFCDDLGYGDIGPFGSTKHATPVLDQMAKEGMKLTDFYSTCPVCTPSRSSLMTGCYPRRVNMHVDEKNLCVLFPAARKGLNPSEITVAEVLKEQGYATMCIGKWHLGDHPDFMPTSQGFDHYFGIPYSNDMNRKQVPLPLVRDLTTIKDSVQRDTTITTQYTTEAVKFIKANSKKPFFLYLPHTAVHLPLVPGEKFKGTSKDGPYGDWVQEIDWSMGELFKALKAEGIDENTFVLFTSDNGSFREKQGSNLPLRGRKGRTDEGGMRVPCVVRWPGKIPAGTASNEFLTSLEIFPMLCAATGAAPPKGLKLDGFDMLPVLQSKKKSPRKEMFWQRRLDKGARVDHWKWVESSRGNGLFDLRTDLSEKHDLSKEKPDVLKMIKARFADWKKQMNATEPRGPFRDY